MLVPTYHCPTMIAPVVHAGDGPDVLSDHGAARRTWNGCAQADLAGVRVMLAAHYFGLPQPMAVIRTFCDERGINLIEDCAHAFFGVSDDRPVGSWGDVAIASLTKFFPGARGRPDRLGHACARFADPDPAQFSRRVEGRLPMRSRWVPGTTAFPG